MSLQSILTDLRPQCSVSGTATGTSWARNPDLLSVAGIGGVHCALDGLHLQLHRFRLVERTWDGLPKPPSATRRTSTAGVPVWR